MVNCSEIKDAFGIVQSDYEQVVHMVHIVSCGCCMCISCLDCFAVCLRVLCCSEVFEDRGLDASCRNILSQSCIPDEKIQVNPRLWSGSKILF